jgi:hydroxymethylbilane synthase
VRLVLATRRSPLAVAQTEWVAEGLRAAGHEVELLALITSGDRWSAGAPNGGEGPGKGIFVKELEEALLDGRADLAVHSAKDVPTVLPDGLALVGVSHRADPRDVLIGSPAGLPGLRIGARVGTGSPRRAAQLAEARPDLEIVEIRGNVGTRIDKMERGEVDALVLAAAGLERLGLAPSARAPLPVAICTPAPGQGYLALEGRAGADEVARAASALGDPLDRVCLDAERAVLAGLGGGCRSAVGAYCEPLVDGALRLTVYVREEDEEITGARATVEGAPAAAALARSALAALASE